jgi:hypothetical protein
VKNGCRQITSHSQRMDDFFFASMELPDKPNIFLHSRWRCSFCFERKIMKKVLLLVCISLFGIPAFAQSITPAEREKGVQYLEQTRDGVVAAVKGLSSEQMKFKPAPDRWSVAETLEHIALAENDAHNLFAQAMKSPAGPPDPDFAKVDAMILAMVPDRSRKAQAPPQLVPTGRWTPKRSIIS